MFPKKMVEFLFSPIVFGLGFVAPLIAQILDRLKITMGIENVYVGLIGGLSPGFMAQLRAVGY